MEEETRKKERKKKFTITMCGETQERRKISPIVISTSEVQPCRLYNTLGVGEDLMPGVKVEGVEVMVPGAEYNNIYEQPKDSRNIMTQQLDGTSGSETGPELGPIAEVGEGQGYYDERESSFCQAL